MFETGDVGAPSVAQGGPQSVTLVLLAANVAVWVAASTMLASYGL